MSNLKAVHSSKQYTLVQTATAYIDLLGLSNKLAVLDRIVANDLPKDEATTIVKNTIGTIMEFRTTFLGQFSALEEAEPTIAAAIRDPRLHALWKQSLDYDVRLTHFSDSVVINIVIDKGNLAATLRGLIMLVAATSLSSIAMFVRGQPVRGAIETGVAIDAGDNEAIGSGLAHAYRIETEVAVYPRICVGPRLQGFLTMVADSSKREELGLNEIDYRVISGHVDLLKTMFTRDSDGILRVDYTSDLVKHSLKATGHLGLIDNAVRALSVNLNQLDPARDLKIMAKLQWLIDILKRSSISSQAGGVIVET